MIWMRAAMNDTVHVQIEMIKLWQECRVSHDLVYLGITF
jgi:hypothetical protein